ncbi:helix-turn-helix domain-containing protein [Actinomadura viridis]|uniref:Transcriptional regulator with XRE-family HTH domain n=1 Tax=Actinomadura viridis TaxID=58110 RepID=A0A931DML4_9ACTN|nr:helix-turn-helix transcriptional regulator [Actinomadura viridis]MBG6089880.1 transcriptional regulator with XRE-family HTH domain [Actinomadura viridis]
MRELDVFPLEAWRLANGWSRTEVSRRIDMLYEADGLMPPGLDSATLCRWELGERRPGEERIDYLCRLYRTRPDRLGYGTDHTGAEVPNLQRAGIVDAYPYTCQESEQDLRDRLAGARHRINLFGLSRNYYVRGEVLPLLEERAGAGVPVHVYVMDPGCCSRRDRYRIEPAEATMEDPERYTREILVPLHRAAGRHEAFRIFTFNFPCSFAIEEIDDACRVMIYGHGKRGTQGPIITFGEGSPSHTYLADQIRWLERLAEDPEFEPWASKGIRVRPLEL